jgi:hypothetical protein
MRLLQSFLVIALLGFGVMAQADEFVGFGVGPSYVNQGIGLKFGGGFETAGKLDPHWSLGFGVNYQSLGVTVAGQTDSATLLTFLGQVNYHAWEKKGGPWIGGRAGVGVITNYGSISGSAPGTFGEGGSSNEFTYGGGIGFDKEMSDEWTWGPVVQYVIVHSGGGNIGVANFLLELRYWPE